jgi:hypothetical protein
MKKKLFIQTVFSALSLLAMTSAFTQQSIADIHSSLDQAQSLNQDTQTLSNIFSSQGDIHRHVQIGTVMTISSTISSAFVKLDGCTMITQLHWDSEELSSSMQKDHDINTYNYSYNLHDIVNISTEPTGPKDQPNFNYEQPVLQINVQLNNKIIPERTFHESTRNDNSPVPASSDVIYYVKSESDARTITDTLHHLAQTCKTVSQQTADDLPSDEQAHYKQVLTHGKPSQMYSMALDMADEGHSELALKMLQAIVDRYPDDPYVAKAIDKKEAIRAAMKKSPESTSGIRHDTGVSSPNLTITNGSTNDNKLQQIQACQASCQSSKKSCDMTYSNNMGTQLGNTINSLRGHNSVAAQNSGSQILGDPNACQDEFDSCTARCH